VFLGGPQTDLSSPSLLPELIKSRTFVEKIIDKEFYSYEYSKKLPLLSILTHGNQPTSKSKEVLITNAMGSLATMIHFINGPPGSFSEIRVTANNPNFAKSLAEVVLEELEALNKDLKTKSVNEKTAFIENRISNVMAELSSSEKSLRSFREQNRQISSPSLMLLEEKLLREVEIQKGIYLTLKQQLELAKIEEVQTSILQILDKPQLPLSPSNKNLRLSIILAGFFGIGLAMLVAFSRDFTKTPDITERKKLRKGKNFLKKKI
jgi:Uncharacterized protein involved in exopolysaccharide biosynthesis